MKLGIKVFGIVESTVDLKWHIGEKALAGGPEAPNGPKQSCLVVL